MASAPNSRNVSFYIRQHSFSWRISWWFKQHDELNLLCLGHWLYNITINAHFCCPSNFILRFPHRYFEQKKRKIQMKLFLNANMHTPRMLIQKKKCWFVKPPLQLERYLFSATISRHFYFKYKYTYGSFVFEQLLMWVKTFCHHVEQGGPAEMNDIFFFSRKKSTYSLPACSEFWFLVFLSLQTLNIKRLRYFLKLFSVVMPH